MGPDFLSRIQQIIDPSDLRIAPYVSIRERDLTGRPDGRFIVEGKVTLGVLLERSRFDVESLFLCETRVEPLARLLQQVPGDVPVYVAPQGVLDQVAGFNVHRGVLACARKGAGLRLPDLISAACLSDGFAPAPVLQQAQDEGGGGLTASRSTLLVLNQTSNHDNVGAAFRNAAAFGVHAIVLDEQCCDPLYRKAIRVSAGTSLWLPFAHEGTGAEQIAALQAAGFEIWAMTPRARATPLHEMPVPDRVAIMLGAEGPGLPEDLINAAVPVGIPMSEGFDSVNVATAGAIALSYVLNARRMG